MINIQKTQNTPRTPRDSSEKVPWKIKVLEKKAKIAGFFHRKVSKWNIEYLLHTKQKDEIDRLIQENPANADRIERILWKLIEGQDVANHEIYSLGNSIRRTILESRANEEEALPPKKGKTNNE